MKKNKSPLIYLISCSVRSNCDEKEIVDNVKKITSETHLYKYIENISRGKKISNSEGGLIASAFGVLPWAKNLKYIRLNKYFLKSGKIINSKLIFKKIKKADGIIFSTPVYFGDRSSILHDFVRICEEEKIDLSGKVIGFISVGAKRNGGQETTNIYAIHNFTELGALVVGNGPPTSQFGGTLVGGEKGTMENDYFGIMTSMGVGRKVAQVASIVKEGSYLIRNKKSKCIVDFWILEDEGSKVKKYLESLIKNLSIKNKEAEFKLLDLTKYNFNRCFACSICPYEKNKSILYKCINKNDDMKKLHSRLLESDAIVIAGLSLENVSKKNTVYQRFVERTRYIRRNDFLLTNKLVAAISLNELSANSLFNLRVLTSFIRHNTVFHKGFEEFIYQGKILVNRNREVYDIFGSFVKYANILKLGKTKVDIGKQKYSEISF